MHWQVVTPCLHSEARARSQHGRLGRLTHWDVHLSGCSPLSTFAFWLQSFSENKGWLSSFTTKPAPWIPLMKQERSSFAARAKAWTGCHPRRMHSYSMFDEQYIYQATTSTQSQPSPQDFAWSKVPSTKSWVPVWMTIPEVFRACRELIKCSCKGDCTRCKCTKANLACSPLCSCCNKHTANEQILA